MLSNTKITSEQKQWVKNWVRLEDTAKFFHNGKVTVLVMPEFKDSRMYKVSLSTMSPNEIMFRKSVGRYHAINSMYCGHYILMDNDTVFRFLDNIGCLNTDKACETFAGM